MPDTIKKGALSFFTDGFKAMPSWAKIFIMLIFTVLIATVIVVKFTLKPLTDTYIQINDLTLQKETVEKTKKQREIQALEILKQSRTTDSLMEIQDALRSSIALRNSEDIENYIDELHISLENVSNVSFWSMHNGGKVMDVNSPLYLEVHKSSDKNVEDSWSDPEKIPQGYLWSALELEKKRVVYIPDVTKEKKLWLGSAKTNMQTNGTKSIIGAIVKNSGSDWYFVSISFKSIDPYLENPNIYREINAFKNYVKRRI